MDQIMAVRTKKDLCACGAGPKFRVVYKPVGQRHGEYSVMYCHNCVPQRVRDWVRAHAVLSGGRGGARKRSS